MLRLVAEPNSFGGRHAQTLYVLAAAHSAAAAAKQTIAKVEALAEIKLHDRTGAGGDSRCQRLYFG